MFGSIGVTELFFIAAIALIFLGPEKFPEFAKIAARAFRDVRKYMREAQDEITKEIKPMQEEFKKLTSEDTKSYFDNLANLADQEDDMEIIPEPDPQEFYDESLKDDVVEVPADSVPYEDAKESELSDGSDTPAPPEDPET